MDTSFIFHPTTHHLPVPACPRSLPLFASYLLRQPHRVAPSWALPLSPSLRPSFLLSRSGSVVVSIARGNRDSLPPFLRRCFSLFLLFFVSFLSASILLARSIRPHLSFVLFALYIFFLLSLLLHLNRLQYFGNYSRLLPLVLFFRPETYLYYSPFSFRLYLHSIIDECESNCEKPANEYDAHGYMSISSFYLAFNCRSVKGT